MLTPVIAFAAMLLAPSAVMLQPTSRDHDPKYDLTRDKRTDVNKPLGAQRRGDLLDGTLADDLESLELTGLKSLYVEIHSVQDDVLLLAHEPEFDEVVLWQGPNTQFIQGKYPTLLMRDRALTTTESIAAEPWAIELRSRAPTTFDVQLDEGSAFLDLGGAATRKLNLAAVDASVHIVFRAVNPIPLQEARVTITGETLVVDGILNARLAQMQVDAQVSACELLFTGEPFQGEMQLTFEGAPEQLRIALPRFIGVRVTGPQQTLSRMAGFPSDAGGTRLSTPAYLEMPCRVDLTLEDPVEQVTVTWYDTPSGAGLEETVSRNRQ
jgi:hypothetical protein